MAGHKEGLSVMEQADPLVLLVGLPTIPVMLILGKMIKWEDQVLRFIRKRKLQKNFLLCTINYKCLFTISSFISYILKYICIHHNYICLTYNMKYDIQLLMKQK